MAAKPFIITATYSGSCMIFSVPESRRLQFSRVQEALKSHHDLFPRCTATYLENGDIIIIVPRPLSIPHKRSRQFLPWQKTIQDAVKQTIFSATTRPAPGRRGALRDAEEVQFIVAA